MIIRGDCLEEMKKMPDNSVDAIVTDPPYDLTSMTKQRTDPIAVKGNDGKGNPFCRKQASKGFMGKEWDGTGIAFKVELWKEALRILKPGAHLIAFGGSRTEHRMTVAIEDAGFEIRDKLCWIFASGFPKSLNVHKQLLKQNHPDADKYKGLGTALKPAVEFITLARKPLQEKTIVEQVLKTGTGAIDIDGCRIPCTTEKDLKEAQSSRPNSTSKGMEFYSEGEDNDFNRSDRSNITGRFPANIICTDDALNDNQITKSGSGKPRIRKSGQGSGMFGLGEDTTSEQYSDSGSKSRYFDIDVWAEKYGLLQFPKASKRERNEGCEGLEEKQVGHNTSAKCNICGKWIVSSLNRCECSRELRKEVWISKQNHHPTVKPVHLMSWLVRLVSKEGDTVLDPFTGSGTTGVACLKLNRNFIGIEKEEEYCKIAEARINKETEQTRLEEQSTGDKK